MQCAESAEDGNFQRYFEYLAKQYFEHNASRSDIGFTRYTDEGPWDS